MYCRNCGAFVGEGDKFCIKCGAPMPSAGPGIPAAPTVAAQAVWQAPVQAGSAPSSPEPVASWSQPAPSSPQSPSSQTSLMGLGNPVVAMGAIVFVVLAIIAAIVAAGLSSDEAYDWAAGIYALSAVLFILAAFFFYLAKRTPPTPH